MVSRGLVFYDLLNIRKPSAPANPKFKILFREYKELSIYALLILTTQKWVKKRFHVDIDQSDYKWINPRFVQLKNPGMILLEQSVFEPIEDFEGKIKCRRCPNVGELKQQKIIDIENLADQWKQYYRICNEENRKIRRKVMLMLKIDRVSSREANELKDKIESTFDIKI